MKKKINAILPFILSLAILIAGIVYYTQTKRNPSVFEQSTTLVDVGFDTTVTFSATCTKSEFDQYVSIVQEMYQTYNEYFDIYNEYEGLNNIYTINHTSGPVKVNDTIIECISMALKVHQENPKFDITQGKLLSVWHTYREENKNQLPSQEELEQAYNSNTDCIKIENDTIEITDSNVQLDVGGVAKGFTTQKVKDALIKKGCTKGFINAGGNVVLIGEKEWNVGIQCPDSNDALCSITLNKPTSLVTSGDYQRYYEVNGKMYSHIIDPDTLYPASYYRSVTVLLDDSAEADCYSTLLFTLDYETGKQFAEEHNLPVIWIFDTGKGSNPDLTTDQYDICCTENIKDSIKLID